MTRATSEYTSACLAARYQNSLDTLPATCIRIVARRQCTERIWGGRSRIHPKWMSQIFEIWRF